MNNKLIFVLVAVSLIGCNSNRQDDLTQTTKNKVVTDTIVGSKIITNEIAGSAYRKRAIGYFVIVGKDTSDYTCIFSESTDDGHVRINLNIPYSKNTITYRQRLDELRIILEKASTDFDLDSLTSIYLGRLVLSGDLAIDVTKQYQTRYGNKLKSYPVVENFIKESKLGIDFDNLFKKYSMSVEKVSIEKLFFTSQKELYWASRIETDTINVPDKILDCMTWVKLKRR